MKADEIVHEVTSNIIAKLEEGVAPWAKPWGSDLSLEWPFNPVTRKQYTGFNAIILNICQMDYACNRWITFNQAVAAGGSVRKGAKGTHALRPLEIRKEFEDAATGEQVEEYRLLFRGYTVFNLDQCEGLDHLRPDIMERPEPVVVDMNVMFVADRTGAKIDYWGNRCFYSPQTDTITMVPPERFKDENSFHATLFHELSHWTGHESRLNRLSADPETFQKNYGHEELVAELSATFCCQALGVDSIQPAAEYIGAWIKIMKEDNRAILKASSAAKKSFDMIVPEVYRAAPSFYVNM